MGEPVGFDKVFEGELRAIATRRRVHRMPDPAPDLSDDGQTRQSGSNGNGQSTNSQEPSSKRPLETDLIGLALSGGGVRSASFNLGLIQALDENGVFSQIDYLSTVSGGGYIGGYLSSVSLDEHDDDRNQTPDSSRNRGQQIETNGRSSQSSPVSDRRITPLAPHPRSPQPPRVRKLIYGGDYLRLPMTFVNRYLIGLLTLNLFLFSGVIAASAACAWSFRYLDQTHPRSILYALGFSDDIRRAFFPSFLCGISWIVAWLVSYWRSGTAATAFIARGTLAIFAASLLVGVATVLGTGQLNVDSLAQLLHLNINDATVETIQGWLKVLVITPVLFFLIPYFRPDRLLKSGLNPRTRWYEPFLFKSAGLAMLIGVPLLVVGFLTRENISNYNEERDGTFVPSDVNWAPFWRIVKAGEAQSIQLSTTLANSHAEASLADIPEFKNDTGSMVDSMVARQLYKTGTAFDRQAPQDSELKAEFMNLPTTAVLLDKIREIEIERDVLEANLSFHQRWLSFGRTVIGRLTGEREATTFSKLYHCRRDIHYLQMAAMANVNVELRNPTLYDDVEKSLVPLIVFDPNSLPRDEEQQEGSNGSASVDATVGQELEPLSLSLDKKRRDELTAVLLEAHAIANEKPPIQNDADKAEDDDPRVVEWRKKVTDVNRRLLTAYYGADVVRPQLAGIWLTAVIDHDQAFRLQVFMWALGIFVFGGFALHLNATSLHGYYRNQIAHNWVERCGGFDHNIPLARLDTTARGYPYHLISATANYFRRQARDQASRGHFLFSRLYCGSSRTGYERTDTFAGGKYDLASAMAISGAAVSPAYGSNLFLSLMLLLLNFRLGQWLPNPGYKSYWPHWLQKHLVRWPSPFMLIFGLLRPSETRAFCLITDGGHHENLGVGPLLRRQCRLILCSDVGHDPTYEFQSLIALQMQQRLDNGIEICAIGEETLNFDVLLPDQSTRLSKTHFVLARVRYPHFNQSGDAIETCQEDGYLIYIKPTFTSKVELDLATEMRSKSEFPHDSTADQFYPAEKFECYRRLGYHIGKQLCNDYFGGVRLSDWKPALPAKCHEIFVSSSVSLPPSPVEQVNVEIANPVYLLASPERLVERTPPEQRREIDFALKSLTGSPAEQLLENAPDESAVQAYLVQNLLEKLVKKGNEKERETVAQLLKLYTQVSPRVQETAISICLDRSEPRSMRMAALDLFAATRLESADAKRAIQKLRSDSDTVIRRESRKLFSIPTARKLASDKSGKNIGGQEDLS